MWEGRVCIYGTPGVFNNFTIATILSRRSFTLPKKVLILIF